MKPQRDDVVEAIRRQVIRIAAMLGTDASDLGADELIPASGYIDSAGLLELIGWFESAYALSIPPADLTVDNLGSAAQMADYLLRRQGAA